MAAVDEGSSNRDGTPGSTGSHAGARTSLTVAQRLAHIVGMMERLEWERGRSAPRLAAEWGLATNTVERDAAEASRRCTADADEVRRDLMVVGRRLLMKADRDEDDKAFKNIADVLATVSGAKAPEKHQIGALDGATPGKAREVMSELFSGGVSPDGQKPSDPER
jgi:flagellar motility protein MotE (MotC chaperone)